MIKTFKLIITNYYSNNERDNCIRSNFNHIQIYFTITRVALFIRVTFVFLLPL